MIKAELVVLLHGYVRTALTMGKMKRHLEFLGYDIFAPTLPTTFKRVEDCTVDLEKRLKKISIGDYKRVHFVGHSMGGLIIRAFLSKNLISNLGRCVLISTPNGGSPLAVKVIKISTLVQRISPPFNDFVPGLEIASPLNDPFPAFGVIAGNESTFFPGALIKEDNDSRIPVSATAFNGMKELIVVPFRHTRIHKQSSVASLVDRFLRKGKFKDDAFTQRACRNTQITGGC